MTGNPQITFFGGGDEVRPRRDIPKPNPQQIRQHTQRLVENRSQVLYHQTSPENATKILASREMLRGSSGLAGGGIYFATTPEHTNHKALSRGTILECEVALGRTYTTGFNGDRDLCFRQLVNSGYDSVKIPRSNGTEYVVYNKSQVKEIKRYQPPQSRSWLWW